MSDSPADLPAPSTQKSRRTFWTLLRLALSMAVLATVLQKYALGNIIFGLGGRLVPLMLAGFLLTMLSLLLNSARWVVVISAIGAPLSYREAGALTLIGHFLSQLLPTSVGGDVFRIWGAWRAGISFAKAAASVLIERLIGIWALAMFVLAGLVGLAQRMSSVVPLAVAGVMIFGAASAMVFLELLDRLPARFLCGRIGQGLVELASCARLMRSTPASLAIALFHSVLLQVSLLLLTTLLARSFGAPLTIIDALMVVPAVLVLSNLPISIGGWGIREAGLLGGFSMLGLPGEAAVATSVMIGLLSIAAAVPGAILLALRGPWARSAGGPFLETVEHEAAATAALEARDRRSENRVDRA